MKFGNFLVSYESLPQKLEGCSFIEDDGDALSLVRKDHITWTKKKDSSISHEDHNDTSSKHSNMVSLDTAKRTAK